MYVCTYLRHCHMQMDIGTLENYLGSIENRNHCFLGEYIRLNTKSPFANVRKVRACRVYTPYSDVFKKN